MTIAEIHTTPHQQIPSSPVILTQIELQMHKEDLQSLICQQSLLLSPCAQHESQPSSDVKPLGTEAMHSVHISGPWFTYLNPAFPE